MLHKSFNSAKCKTSLKLASSRIKLLKNKRQQTLSKLRREVSKLLEAGQDQSARIQVEHVIREEKTVAAYEFIELFCELIAARLQIIETQKACPIDLKEAIASVIFASQRCPDVNELSDVRKRLAAKYGKEFVVAALELRPNCGVSSLLVEKLSVKTPDIETKIRVLTSIATEYGIDWEPKAFEEQLQKTKDERLDGPSSFGAVKMVTEPTKSEFSVQSSHTNEPAIKPPEKAAWNPVTYSVSSSISSSVSAMPSEKEVQSPVTYSASSTSSSAPIKYQTEPRPSEPSYQSTHSENSYSRGMADSSKLERWNTEFKDASSAARAAAESAERANLAARAAAEFASQETHTRQFVTGHGETSPTVAEIASRSKAENVQADFKDPGLNSSRMKETSRVSKSSEHHASEVMHHDYRAKNKAKEDFEEPRGSSSRSKSPSPPSCDLDKPDPTLIHAGKSSLRITSEQVTEHGQTSSQTMHDDLIETYSTVSEDDEEEEEMDARSNSSHNDREEYLVGSESSHNYKEEEHLVRTNFHHHKASSDANDLRSDDNMISKDAVGNNVHEEGTRAHNTDETGDREDHHQGINTAVFDDYGPDDGDFINVFSTLHDNVVELDLLKSKPADSSSYQDSWLHKDTKSEPFIERHADSHIFSSETTHTENGEDVMEGSPPKFDEPLSPKYDEPLSLKYDEIDGYDHSDSEADKRSHLEEGKSISTGVSYPGRAGSINIYSSPEDQIGQGLKLDSITGGFKQKGFVRPPYVRSSPESHPSKERVDDPSDRAGHGTKSVSDKFLDEKATTTVESTSLSSDFKHGSDRLLGRDVYAKNSQDEDDIEPGFNSSRQYSDFGRFRADPQTRSHLDFSSERLSGRDIYGEKSHDVDDDMGQGSESSRQNSDFGSSKVDRQSRDRFEHFSRDQLSRRHMDDKTWTDKDDSGQGFKSSKQYSDLSSSKEDSQPRSPVASRRTRTGIQSRRTKGMSMSNSESRSIQQQLDGDMLDIVDQQDTQTRTMPTQSRSSDVKSRWNSKYNSKTLQDEGAESLGMSNQRDSETETKSFQSSSYDVKGRGKGNYSSKPLQIKGVDSLDKLNQEQEREAETKLAQSGQNDVKRRWNNKYSSKQLEDEGAESSRKMDELSIREAPESSLNDFTYTADEREEMKMTSRSELHSRSYKNEAENLSHSAPKHTVLADPETPSKSDLKNRWNSKYSPPSEKHLPPQAQTDEFSGKELHASPSAAQATTKGMPESSDRSPTKLDLRNRWSNKYSPLQPSELAPSQMNESSKKSHAALPATAQPEAKGAAEISDGSSSKSDMRNRRINKYSPSQPPESEVSRSQSYESSKRELHAALPSTMQPRTKGIPESSEGSSSKSDVQKRWSNKYTASQLAEKNLVPPVQRNESPKKELHTIPSAGLHTVKGVPEALDVSSSKSDAQTRWDNKYVPPLPSEKYVAPLAQTRGVSPEESQALPPTVQPIIKGTPESLDGPLKREKLESQSSGQLPSTQPECILRTVSENETETPSSSQVSVDSPLRHVHPKLPDYETFAARFKSLKSNQRKK